MTDPRAVHHEGLRRDVPTGVAAFLCLLALLMPAVALTNLLVEGPQIEARGNPLYWAILGIPALWAWRVMDYGPGVLRTIRPLLFAAPVIAGGVLAAAAAMHDEAVLAHWVMLALTIVFTLGRGIAYNRSLLAREGAGG